MNNCTGTTTGQSTHDNDPDERIRQRIDDFVERLGVGMAQEAAIQYVQEARADGTLEREILAALLRGHE